MGNAAEEAGLIDWTLRGDYGVEMVRRKREDKLANR